MISKSRVSGIIHIVGGVLAIAALVLLVVFSSLKAIGLAYSFIFNFWYNISTTLYDEFIISYVTSGF